MTLRHIRIFLAVCENGNNITRAAEQLLLAQPAVSLAIRELERYYGVKLFDRISRRLYLTETGKRFRNYAEHIASLYDLMERDLRDGDALGVLRIGCSITIGSQLMPDYVRRFSEFYPGLEVYVHIERSEWLEEAVLRNELDFALTEGLVHDRNLISEDYLDDELIAVCSSEGPFQKDELVSAKRFLCQRLLLREKGSGTRELFDHVMESAGYSVSPAWEGVSTAALVNAAAAGIGVAVLPKRMIAQALEQGKLVDFHVEGLEFRRKFHIIYHKNKYLTSGARAFMELCRSDGNKQKREGCQ